MNTAGKIASATTAAIVTAAGVYLGTTTTNTENQTAEVIDDVVAVQVELPHVEIPKVNIPSVAIGTVEIPQINGTEIVSAYDAEKYGIASIASELSLRSSISLPSVANPTIAAVISVVPELKQILLEKPEITTAEIVKLLVNTPGVDIGKIQQITMLLPTVVNPAERIPRIQEFVKECQILFKDQRGIQYDKTISIDNQSLASWMELYRQKFSYTASFVKLPENIRMVAEIHHPINIDVLDKNLEFYAGRGYNSVLITFGYEGETIGQLLDVAELVKSKGMNPWFAYAGPEKLEHSVFKDPVQLKFILRSFAKVCSGFFMGWRRTSAHLFEQDQYFTNYMISAVRTVNPAIPIVGEAYYGQSASSNDNLNNLEYNIPANSSGVLIAGLGYNRVAVEPVLNGLLKKIKAMDRLVLITGDKPYYATRTPNNKTFLENLKIKEDLAERWKTAGCSGVVVLHGDGSDGIYSKDHCDNIATMEVNQMK